MSVTLEYSGAMAHIVGEEHGLSEKDLSDFLEKHSDAPPEVEKKRVAGGCGFMDLHKDAAGVEDILDFAVENRGKYENLVVVGIGGSALGTTALVNALCHPYHNLASKPCVFVTDNIDPDVTASLFSFLDPEKTLVNVITKSGSTAETISTFAVALKFLKDSLGDNWRKHVVATTDPEKGPLRAFAEKENLATFPVPGNVGGRFSVLSAVGLLPAAILGIDVTGLLRGAETMDSEALNEPPSKNRALVYAAITHMLDIKKNKNTNVFMPYSSRLKELAFWFRQLWAESLGKKFDLDGNVVHVGQTPVASLGATDQHSQVQLYTEGPNDKLITLLNVEKPDDPCQIPAEFEDPSLAYLGGTSLEKLIAAEAMGTEKALADAERPVVRFDLDSVSAENFGYLVYMLELATVYAGRFYNINPFNQPGVEAGKKATYALMGRPGYEDLAREIRKTGAEGATFKV